MRQAARDAAEHRHQKSLANRLKLKRQNARGQENFFEKARMLAMFDYSQNRMLKALDINSDIKNPLLSPFIDESYQEKHVAFSAVSKSVQDELPNPTFVAKTMGKLASTLPIAKDLLVKDLKLSSATLSLRQDALKLFHAPTKGVRYNGTAFEPEEIQALLFGLSSQTIETLLGEITSLDFQSPEGFHELMISLADHNGIEPLIFSLTDSEQRYFVMDQAVLFFGHRLRKKTWQLKGGVKASIRYFHAALRSSLDVDQTFDVVYSLVVDENLAVTGGSFINGFENQVSSAWFLKDQLTNYINKKSQTSTPLSALEFEILKVYFTSISY